MRQRHLSTFKQRSSQRGATLLIGLVLLVVMTLVAVSSTRLATFQTIMASNLQLQTLAASRAEAAITADERDVLTLVSDGVAHDFNQKGDRLYLPGTIDVSLPDWQEAGFTSAQTDTGRYVIGYGGMRPIAGESARMEDPLPGSAIHSFVISAESTSARGARRVLQTVFVTEDGP